MVGLLMYGRSEHAYVLRRIGDVTREVQAAQDVVRAVRVDLVEDAPAETEDARVQLREAAVALGIALNRCDKAVALLPTPVAR